MPDFSTLSESKNSDPHVLVILGALVDRLLNRRSMILEKSILGIFDQNTSMSQRTQSSGAKRIDEAKTQQTEGLKDIFIILKPNKALIRV